MSDFDREQRSIEARWQDLLARQSQQQLSNRLGDLDPRPLPRDDGDSLQPASVLVLLERTPGYHLILTKRSEQVEHHKGEISLPGGVVDAIDVDPVATALRETHEELGIVPRDVTVLGSLSQLVTVTNFIVTPIVGVIDAGTSLSPQETEVARVIHLPLDHLCNRDNWIQETRQWQGKSYSLKACRFGEDIIWGATFRILQNFLSIIQPD